MTKTPSTPESTGQSVPKPGNPDQIPGDFASPGTPGMGENICPACSGTGMLKQEPCPVCNGTGRVIAGIGGG